MKTRPRLHTLAAAAFAVAALAPMSTPSHAATATPANASACPAILQHRFERLQDEKPQDLCQYAGQVVLVVNTASYCGFTQQYKGLEELYRRYRDRGLVVLGFPSNDFGQQEPGSNQQIAEFCENTFGVQFPMFAKSHVRGPQANALFRQLAERTGTTPKWNFYKYLISRDGRTVLAYNSLTAPDSGSLRRDIERLLGS
ncbi:glutathione peroxidase [Tepidimonas sp.]|uniref:glutathione peroxidase n=1 Tax=Tepidimonas sp. TaxID=2002775 RepID=UPI00391A217D